MRRASDRSHAPRKNRAAGFAVSSAYAGCAGALLYTITGFFDPSSFSLLLSVQYIAMVLIGGAVARAVSTAVIAQ